MHIGLREAVEIERLTVEQQIFAEENHNLIYSFLHKNKLSQDWYGVVAIGFVKSVATFDKERGSFSTWAFKCMQNAWWMEARKAKASSRNGLTISIDAPIAAETSACTGDFLEGYTDLENDATFTSDLGDIISSLSPTQLAILKFSLLGFSQLEIATRVGLSQSYVSRLKQQIETVFRKYRQGDDIGMPRWVWTKQRKEDARNYHRLGESAEQIASRLGCEAQQVVSLLEADCKENEPVVVQTATHKSLLEAKELCLEAWEICGDTTPPVLAYYLGRIRTILEFAVGEAGT